MLTTCNDKHYGRVGLQRLKTGRSNLHEQTQFPSLTAIRKYRRHLTQVEDLRRDSGISKGEEGQFDLEKRLVLSAFLHMDGDKVESGSSLSSTTGLANLDQPPCNELQRRRKTSQSEAEILRVGKAQARHRKKYTTLRASLQK